MEQVDDEVIGALTAKQRLAAEAASAYTPTFESTVMDGRGLDPDARMRALHGPHTRFSTEESLFRPAAPPPLVAGHQCVAVSALVAYPPQPGLAPLPRALPTLYLPQAEEGGAAADYERVLLTREEPPRPSKRALSPRGYCAVLEANMRALRPKLQARLREVAEAANRLSAAQRVEAEASVVASLGADLVARLSALD